MSCQPLPRTPGTLPHRRGLLLLALLVVSLPGMAGEVYQWKDANGVTHYSDSPPAGDNYKNRNIHTPDPEVENQASAAAPAVNAQCAAARSNLDQLDSGTPVGIDKDGDGKADGTLSDEERAAQKQLAEAAIQVHCQAS
ncbi:DUF4124 domain-containing protein [Marilutibacter spongiae]|uniref:DUF4124 domain-containing protein n=1 Tax=Marilutibacter spongiae TaxID=2025720 RepID=A0A7W3Y4L6_9GAMM|nr:DUF4124 domain-containing protein [Lysobacter spongiae]MBB1059054.1 DUF4124 domain-containing protein [Lysobacter spongiae]